MIILVGAWVWSRHERRCDWWLVFKHESVKTRLTSWKEHQRFNKTTSQKLRHRFYTVRQWGLFNRFVSESHQTSRWLAEGAISKPLENTQLVGLVSDPDEPTLRQQDPNSSEWASELILFPLNQLFDKQTGQLTRVWTESRVSSEHWCRFFDNYCLLFYINNSSKGEYYKKSGPKWDSYFVM